MSVHSFIMSPQQTGDSVLITIQVITLKNNGKLLTGSLDGFVGHKICTKLLLSITFVNSVLQCWFTLCWVQMFPCPDYVLWTERGCCNKVFWVVLYLSVTPALQCFVGQTGSLLTAEAPTFVYCQWKLTTGPSALPGSSVKYSHCEHGPASNQKLGWNFYID